MAEFELIDRTAEKLLRDQEFIIRRLRHALERLATVARAKKVSSTEKYTIPWKSPRTVVTWRREREQSNTRDGFGEIWEDLMKATKQIDEFPQMDLRLRHSQNTGILENIILVIQSCLQSLEAKLGGRKHQSFTKRLFSKTVPREQWLYQIDNARDCAYLLQDSINISRCIDDVSVNTGRISSIGRLDDNVVTIDAQDRFEISSRSSVITDYAFSVASDRRLSHLFPIESDAEWVVELKTARARSNSAEVTKAAGSWADDELHDSHVPRARTWPTLDEYYPTSAFHIPPPKTLSTTIPSDLIAEPRIKKLFSQWKLPDYNKRHASYQKQRLEGTCEWILKEKNFLDWRDSEPVPNSTLLFLGQPGVGKSVLSSFIIDNLEHTSKPNAYYYLTDNDSDPALELAMSILKQLCEKTDFIPECLLDPKTHAKALRLPTSIDELAMAYHQVAPRCQNFYIIIDGLDELSSNDSARRLEDISELFMGQNLRLCATSRRMAVPEYPWKFVIDIEKRRDLEDIKFFVAEAIKGRKPFYQFPEDAIAECASNIAKDSNGIFFRAAVSVDQLLKASLKPSRSTVSLVDAASHSLALSQARLGLESIKRRSESLRVLAMTSIAWTKDLKGPLQLAGLSEALLVNTKTDYGDRSPPKPHVLSYDYRQVDNFSRTILDLCQGILKEDPSTFTVGFRHEEIEDAVPEWLEQNDGARLPRLDEVILGYLSSGDFSQGPRESLAELQALLSRYRFLSYAAQKWSLHARRARDEHFNELLVYFLKSSNNVALALQVAYYEDQLQKTGRAPADIGDRTKYELSPLQAAARYGFDIAALELLNQPTEAPKMIESKTKSETEGLKQSQSRTKIETVIPKRIQSRTTIEIETSKRTRSKTTSEAEIPRQTRSRAESETELSDRSSTVSKTYVPLHFTQDAQTEALCIAAEHGHLEVVKVLLNRGSRPDATNGAGQCALDYAVSEKQVPVFLELIRQQCVRSFKQHIPPGDIFGPDVDRLKSFSDFFLHCKGFKSKSAFYSSSTLQDAVETESIDTLTILFASPPENFKPPRLSLGETKRSALQWAVKRLLDSSTKSSGKQAVVEFLLRNGADPDEPDGNGTTALFQAVSRNLEDPLAVQLLLDYGADVNQTQQDGRTVLFEAVRLKNLSMVKLLFSNGANIRTVDNKGRSILHEAALHPDEQIIAELVFRFLRFPDYEKWLTAQDKSGQTPAEYSVFDEKTNDRSKVFQSFLESPKVAGFLGKRSSLRVVSKEIEVVWTK